MTEEEVNLLAKELSNNPFELRHYIAEHVDPETTDAEIDQAVKELTRSILELEFFIINTRP